MVKYKTHLWLTLRGLIREQSVISEGPIQAVVGFSDELMSQMNVVSHTVTFIGPEGNAAEKRHFQSGLWS